MQAEYFPPKEDVILQNETPTDLYIVVSGAVVQEQAAAWEIFGEIGVLLNMPQPFTFRTRELSQLLRLSRTSIMTVLQANIEDGIVIMNNLLQKMKQDGDISFREQHFEPWFILNEWLDGGPRRGKQRSHLQHEEDYVINASTEEATEEGILLCRAAKNGDMHTVHEHLRLGVDANSTDMNGQTALHAAVLTGNIEIAKVQLNEGADMYKLDTNGWTPKAAAEKQKRNGIYELLLRHENKERKTEHHQIELSERSTSQSKNRERSDFNLWFSKETTNSDSIYTRSSIDGEMMKTNKRVTLHPAIQKTYGSQEHHQKLIILPDSLDELYRISNQKFAGCNPTKVVNQDNAEIDDITLVRDGDHLYLLENECDER
ncbi:Potassium channel KAT1 [Acorus calamus]|uniref:Potassium channel n=1 Tax=Acorus calamus TaxID=4465 RepID=A0AAV9FA13_ACOCL|nr:Potassium channel KAT1 [Acorus calamus]